MKYTVLYNPFSSSRKGRKTAHKLKKILGAENTEFVDITGISDFEGFMDSVPEDRGIVLCGGDGTLNRFINSEGLDPAAYADRLYCCPGGSGNDFYKDVKKREKHFPIPLAEYFRGLPTAVIGGKLFRFLNGIGAGIDGYVCDLGNRLREKTGKKVDYTACALRGLFGDYSPLDVRVTVDGVVHEFRKSWLAPVMNGRYFGGGMCATPAQDRIADDGRLSVLVFSGTARFPTLCIFPVIFTGLHVRFRKYCRVLTGNEISVEYSSPQALQIDGETLTGVSSFSCRKLPRA
ncbi:MAG: diacylglycerol kinase family protein [Clostridia bacterium]|nr:diacylglycerol kinase family protein [Clostridia bacterium]